MTTALVPARWWVREQRRFLKDVLAPQRLNEVLLLGLEHMNEGLKHANEAFVRFADAMLLTEAPAEEGTAAMNRCSRCQKPLAPMTPEEDAAAEAAAQAEFNHLFGRNFLPEEMVILCDECLNASPYELWAKTEGSN